MKIQIELIVTAIVIFVFLAWAIWYRISNKIANKNYNPHDDKGRRAEEERKRLIGKERGNGRTGENPENPISSSSKQGEPAGNTNVSTTTSSGIDEDKHIPRKASRSDGKVRRRNPFRKRR